MSNFILTPIFCNISLKILPILVKVLSLMLKVPSAKASDVNVSISSHSTLKLSEVNILSAIASHPSGPTSSFVFLSVTYWLILFPSLLVFICSGLESYKNLNNFLPSSVLWFSFVKDLASKACKNSWAAILTSSATAEASLLIIITLVPSLSPKNKPCPFSRDCIISSFTSSSNGCTLPSLIKLSK